MKLLVACPLPLEQKFLVAHLKSQGYRHRCLDIGKLRVYEFPEIGWLLALGGHGKTQFGIQTQFLLNQFPNLDALICAGCAGGLNGDLAIGDIVIAQKTVEHDYRLEFIKKPMPEFLGDSGLIEKCRKIHFDSFKLHFGTIASGDEDIIDVVRANEVQLKTDALAVAWEGAGGARTCEFSDMPYLEVRGVTDYANVKASSDFKTNLQTAMNKLAQVLLKAFT